MTLAHYVGNKNSFKTVDSNKISHSEGRMSHPNQEGETGVG